MKKIFNIMFAVVACLVTAACQKEEVKDTVDPALVGEWHLTSVEVDGMVKEYPYDVYLSINSDCTFKLYQKSGDQIRYTRYSGTCRSEGDKFLGAYSSGFPLNGGPYTAEVAGDDLTLITNDGTERQEYVRETLSEKDKLDADISTRSDIDNIAPIL